MSRRWPSPDGRYDFLRFDNIHLSQMGHIDNFTVERKFGFASAVPTTITSIYPENDLYTYPSSAVTMTVSSSDTDDTSAGAGAQTVKVFGLDADYAEISETVSMNGQTGVTTSNSYIRVHRMQVITAGASDWNEGIVYMGTGSITTGKPAVVHGAIAVNENQTLQAIYTVPASRKAYVTHISLSVGTGKQVIGGLYARPDGETFQIKQKFILKESAGPVNMDFQEFEAKTDLEIRGAVDASTAPVSASFSMLIRDMS